MQQSRMVGVMNARNRPRVEKWEDVYRHIFNAILDQRLLPGTKLSEFALMETFGVSRRSVGAALQRLAWEKLIVLFSNRGAFVAAPDADEARDIFLARVAIEGGTTGAVARRGDPDAIAALTDSLQQEKKLRQAGRVREAIHLSGGFHVLMADLSHNTILAEQVRILVARTSLVIHLFENQLGLSSWHDHHDELISLCAKKQVDNAIAVMQRHIRELEDSLILERRRPVAFDMTGVFATTNM
jgi:DNA-binding GntR family transcriptional regulator